MNKKDVAVLGACIGASLVTYKVIQSLQQWNENRNEEWIPVGRVKELYIYPIKSCKGKKTFSLLCDAMGPVFHENKDRMFLVVDETGHFYTARVCPQLVLVQSEVRDNVLYLEYKGDKCEVPLEEVLKKRELIHTTLFDKSRTDGYDCGSEAEKFFTKVVGQTSRLALFSPELFTERTCKTESNWWINEVPKRDDKTAFVDLAPFHITTQASLDALNNNFDNGHQVPNLQFRANIVVDGTEAWDEDKWSDVRFGNAPDATRLQCIRPCDRCLMTTIFTEKGEKDPAQTTLKTLRKFRIAPGELEAVYKQAPIFGVYAALAKKGYVATGDTVWVKYKKSAF